MQEAENPLHSAERPRIPFRDGKEALSTALDTSHEISCKSEAGEHGKISFSADFAFSWILPATP